MRRLGALGAAALLAAALAPVLGPRAACADQASAALVVDTGERVLRLCVTLPDEPVSGIELIELAAEQHGLAYSLGFGGKAVCSLAGVGPEGSDCFADYPRFWGYWRGDGQGGWTWSSVGAGSTEVEAGDVEGWSWGEGDDGESHPRPPATRFEQVCRAEASPAPSPSPTRSEAPPARSPGAAPSAPSPSPSARAEGHREREPSPTPRAEPTVSTAETASASTSALEPSPARATGPPEGGLGAGPLLAAGLAGTLAVAGYAVRRRRAR